MLTVEELENFMGCLYVRLPDPDNGSYDSGIECNFCSQDGYEFAPIDCLQDAIKPAMEHIQKYHPKELRVLKPVTDEEVAETFGLSLPLPVKISR